MSILAPIFALLLGISVQGGEVPQDPRCPHTDMNFPRGPATRCIGGSRRNYGFAFIYPRAAERIPALMRILRREAVVDESWMRARAIEACAERDEFSDPCPVASLVYEEGWTLNAELPALAAASSFSFFYTGGAHEGAGTDAILVDRRSGRRLALGDLFTNRRRGLAMVQHDFCRVLMAQMRERHQGDDYAAENEMPCPAVGQQPVTLCAEQGRITTMMALLNRYTMGPWAEPGYEVEFAMTSAMIAALKPAYRASFARPRRDPTGDHGVCVVR